MHNYLGDDTDLAPASSASPGRNHQHVRLPLPYPTPGVSSTPVGASSPRRVRVLHVMNRLSVGGTEHGVLKVAQNLGLGDFEHHFCGVRGIDKAFAEQMGVTDRAWAVGTPAPGFQFALFRLVRLMRNLRPQIVHTRNFGALEAIPAARMAGVPIVIHSEHGYELEILAGLPLRRRVLCRAFYEMADAVFSVTRDLRTYHSKQSWLDANKFRVIYNGVNTQRFCPNRENAHQVCRELGIPVGRLIVGTVGRLVPIKDHGTLLRAAETLVRAGGDIQVLMVGNGPELGRLKAYAAASAELSGRVTFLGASPRVPELLNIMDVFVLSSICEGMSNAILEAMACGLPVVATRTGGNPELIADGCTGRLFEPGDVSGLAQLLAALIANERQRREFGEAARARAVGQFSQAVMMKSYRDLYLELAARRGVWKGT